MRLILLEVYITEQDLNPSELFGGVWEVYASGRTLVGLDSSNTKFNAIGNKGGSNSVVLSVKNLPSHSHSTSETVTNKINLNVEQSDNNSQFANYNGYPLYSQKSHSTGDQYGIDFSYGYGTDYPFKIKGIAHTHSITIPILTTTTCSSCNAESFDIQNPYITVYMWKRIS